MSKITLLVKVFLVAAYFSAMALGIAGIWEVIDHDFAVKSATTIYLAGITICIVDSVVFRK